MTKRGPIGRRTFVATAAPALALPAVHARAQAAGVALVIGNSKYHWEATLPNVKRDAPDIARRFQELGLKTELVQDVALNAMRRTIDKFCSVSRGARLAAFYFAGQGARVNHTAYMLSVDADLTSPEAVKTQVDVGTVRDGTRYAAHRLLVFDNCRNNPADGWHQEEALQSATMTPAWEKWWTERRPNMLMLFSTAAGRIALDGAAGQNSPFAAALLRQLGGESTDLQALAGKVRRDLLIATQSRQLLFDLNTYTRPFTIEGPRGQPVANSGRVNEPSKIVELPNAYALAQQHGIPLPPGLIAHRPVGRSSDATKVGSFRYDSKSSMGITPRILVVMSVENAGAAEVVLAGNDGSGGFWRLTPARLSDNRLEFQPYATSPRYVFDWRDANSGSMAQFNPKFSGRFTRLDG